MKYNIEKNRLKIKPEDEEDLFIISQILERGDVIEGKDSRKIKINDETVKKQFYLKLEVENIEEGNPLRIRGRILNEYEEIPKGSYHSFTLNVGKEILITKKKLEKKVEDLLKSKKSKRIKVLILDDEKAEFFEVSNKKIEKLSEISYKTGNEENPRNYKVVLKKLNELNWNNFILAGPGVFKEYLAKYLKEEGKNFYLVNINHSGELGVKELFKRKEVENFFKDLKYKEEKEIFDNFLIALKKGKKVAYGKGLFKLAEYGAIEKLYLNSDLLFREKEEKKKEEIRELIRKVEKNKGEVHLIESDVKKELKPFGDMFAFLRFELEDNL